MSWTLSMQRGTLVCRHADFQLLWIEGLRFISGEEPKTTGFLES